MFNILRTTLWFKGDNSAFRETTRSKLFLLKKNFNSNINIYNINLKNNKIKVINQRKKEH